MKRFKTLFCNLWSLKWTLIYIALIPLINTLYLHVDTVPLPDGGHFTPLSIMVGLVLVFRDFAQREIGHYILFPVLIGTGLAYGMAGPEIALASGLAFFISEIIDWLVYSYTKRPFSERIMLSSLIAAPVDTIVFMVGASMVLENFMHFSTFFTMIASKLAGAYVVSRIVRIRERKLAASGKALEPVIPESPLVATPSIDAQ